MTFQHFIGIDVSKATLDVAFNHQTRDIEAFANDLSGHNELLAKLPDAETALIVIESTGRYE